MSRHDRASALRNRAAGYRHDAVWIAEACPGKEPLLAKRRRLKAAWFELKALIIGWPQ